MQRLVLLIAFVSSIVRSQYVIDNSKLGHEFDGIGGLSAGASSLLLQSYSEKYLDMILDILFKPNFAASLHILKVEIGGDGQSTDGTESSHMHTKTDENYNRGYEWLIMTEAVKRNPNIKLYGLPWTFPSWVGNGSGSPYKYPEVTADYIIKWINGAKSMHNLSIDYIGIWNERPYDSTYIKVLRKALDDAGLGYVQIVAPDGSFVSISEDVLKDPDLAKAVSILGAHYPGTLSPDTAKQTGKKLWSSEDYSTYNDDVGAGCWARILNQNYVNGQMTSTISWNLIASYYNGLPFFREGLMTAIEPWSGHFEINGPTYVSAHTTQFTKPGDWYLPVGNGSGLLTKGGSYVSLVDPKTNDLTVVIETMTHDHSVCIRPSLPKYNVSRQTATFKLQGSLSKVTQLYRWDSQLFNTSDGAVGPQYFIKNGTVSVDSGVFSVDLPVDHVMTLSTKTGQVKGTYDSPPSQPFPVPYEDDFESYEENSQAKYFADQYGVYEIVTSTQSGIGKVMKQMVPEHVISWCGDGTQTISLIGNNTWSSISASVQVILPEAQNNSTTIGAFIVGRLSTGGCQTKGASGVFFWINTAGVWSITSDLEGTKSIKTGSFAVKPGVPYTLSLDLQDTAGTAMIDGQVVVSNVLIGDGKGFIGIGTSGYTPVEFNDFKISKST